MLEAQNTPADSLTDSTSLVPVNVADVDFVRQLTVELFGRTPELEQVCDPSYAGHTWLAVNVGSSLGVSEIMLREKIWVDRVWNRLGSTAGKFALCVYPDVS